MPGGWCVRSGSDGGRRRSAFRAGRGAGPRLLWTVGSAAYLPGAVRSSGDTATPLSPRGAVFPASEHGAGAQAWTPRGVSSAGSFFIEKKFT